MRLRELAARQRRDGAVVLAVDGVLALAEAARGEAHSAAGHGSPKFTRREYHRRHALCLRVLSLRLCGPRLLDLSHSLEIGKLALPFTSHAV